MVYRGGWASAPDESLAKAAECAERARALDDNYSQLHDLLGYMRILANRFI